MRKLGKIVYTRSNASNREIEVGVRQLRTTGGGNSPTLSARKNFVGRPSALQCFIPEQLG